MAPSRLLSLFSTLSVVYSLPSPTFAATSSSPPSLTSCTSPNSTVSDPSVATLFGRAGNGTLVEYGRTNSGASIRTLCVRNSTGTVYLGGDFLSLSGLPSPYVASFDPGTGTFKSLGQGLDGPVYALSCDDDSGLWVAGAFDRPVGVQNGSSYGGNVAQWDYGTSGWKAPDFGGLDETVRDVQTAGTAQGSSVVFGGDFSVVYANPLSPGLAATNFASLGSALSPVPLNNGNASITASASSSTAGFSDIQNVLCPAGNDGAAGATWLAPDGQDNVSVTVGMGRAVTVGGIRLGNTHLNGAGVNTFQFVSVPGNQVLSLTYLDPTTNLPTICNASCPLAHDPAVPYQDFLFPKGTYFTGFAIQLLSHYGTSSGLHLVQLLSDGAAAYAVQDYNNGGSGCLAGVGALGGFSTSRTNGTWIEESVVANVPGTAQDVLVANVPKGTAPNQGPTLTWEVYVPVDGTYDVHFYTPGCWRRGDCDQRTSVSVLVTPLGNSAASNTTTVDQTNGNDASVPVFTGPLLASTSAGTSPGTRGGLLVTMSLASGAADAKDVELVADKIVLYAASKTGTIVKGTTGRGVWEWVRSGSGAFGDGQGQASDPMGVVNSNGTALDRLGGTLSSAAVVSTVVVAQDVGTTFLGGTFRYSNLSSSAPTTVNNIVGTGGTAVVPAGGLDGPVAALAVGGGYLFAAGTFASSADKAVTGLQGLARWRYASTGSTWEGIGQGSGMAGNVTGLTVSGSTLFVSGAGNAGLAIYDISGSKWVANPFGVGATFVGNVTGLSGATADGTTFFAGNVASSSAAQAARNPSCTPSPGIGGGLGRKGHSVGIVILISMAISLGIVFFGVLFCLLVALLIRRRNGDDDDDGHRRGWGAAGGYGKGGDGDSVDLRHRPTSLLATINAATAAMHEKQMAAAARGTDRSADVKTPASTAAGLGIVGHEGEEEEEDGEEGVVGAGEDDGPDYRRARWSFQEEREGEVSVKAGEQVEVLDRSDSEWWLVRTSGGRQGAIPADWFL